MSKDLGPSETLLHGPVTPRVMLRTSLLWRRANAWNISQHTLYRWRSAYPHQPYVDTFYILLLHWHRPKLVLTGTSILLLSIIWTSMKHLQSWLQFCMILCSGSTLNSKNIKIILIVKNLHWHIPSWHFQWNIFLTWNQDQSNVVELLLITHRHTHTHKHFWRAHTFFNQP